MSPSFKTDSTLKWKSENNPVRLRDAPAMFYTKTINESNSTLSTKQVVQEILDKY